MKTGTLHVTGRQNVTVNVESTKETQKQVRVVKEKRRSTMDARHFFIIGKLSQVTDMDEFSIEDCIISDPKFHLVEEFLSGRTSRKLMFYLETNENEKSPMKKLYLVDETTEVAKEIRCLVFTKNFQIELKPSNAEKEINFISFDLSPGNILDGFHEVLSGVWFSILKSDVTRKDFPNLDVSNFTENIEDFTDKIGRSKTSLLTFTQLESTPLSQGLVNISPSEFRSKAQDACMVLELEKLMAKWMDQIKEMLLKTEQIRREEENFGPSTEIIYWKSRMEQINALLEQLKSTQCRTAIYILQAAKSKSINQWRALDSLVTDYANESKDNVKYLQRLSNVFQLLSKSDPEEALEIIPGLVNHIRLTYCVSSYYNSNERLTSLFSKITNQLIATCKNFLLRGVDKIWHLSGEQLKRRIRSCLKLNATYQQHFRENKKLLEINKSDKQFEFSEHHIFGKFDGFVIRLEQIESIAEWKEDFNELERIKVDGLEGFVRKARTIGDSITNRSGDVLDYRQTQISREFDAYKHQYETLALELENFMETCLEKPLPTLHHVTFLKRFENFPSGRIQMDKMFSKLLHFYSNDIEGVKILYEAEKSNPPVPKNFPPVSGRISWCRQLIRSIDQPMDAFRKMPDIFKSAKGREVAEDYTSTMTTLVEYELTFHRAWCKDVKTAMLGLRSPLLKMDAFTGEVKVNLEVKVLRVLSETKHMRKLQLEVPEFALTLGHAEKRLRKTRERLFQALKEYRGALKSIPPSLNALFKNHVSKVDDAMAPGLKTITWISVKIDEYLTSLTSALMELNRLLKASLDTLKNRIELKLKIMSTPVHFLPSDQPLTVDEFNRVTGTILSAREKELSKCSCLVESAVYELISTLTPPVAANSSLDDVQSAVMNEFAIRCIDALTKYAKGSLEKMKQRLLNEKLAQGEKHPLFIVELSLNKIDSKITMVPNVDKLQGCINALVNNAIKMMERIHQWKTTIPYEALDDRSDTTRSSLMSMNKFIGENQEISKSILQISSIVSSIKIDVTAFIETFSRFQELWQEDQEPNEQSSNVFDLENKLKHFQSLQTMALDLPSTSCTAGCLMFAYDSLKASLVQAAKEKMKRCASEHHSRCSQAIECFSAFVEARIKALEKPIHQLDDVREHVKTLNEVREFEEGAEQTFVPIEETLAIFHKFSINFNDGQGESFEALLYHWNLLKQKAKSVQDHLTRVQPKFWDELSQRISIFKEDVKLFVVEYNERGRTIPDLEPREAWNRLEHCQARLDDLLRKYEAYTEAEILFGLRATSYPQLLAIAKDIGLMQKLFQVYNEILDKNKVYGEVQWKDVDVELMRNDLDDFQARCNKLPTSIKSWKAFDDLKQTIQNFNEIYSMLELMSKNCLQSRHWDSISTVTECMFDVENQNFMLKDVLNAPLLKHKLDIEDICLAATKEREIELKLNSVLIGWNNQEFSFASFKSRGELLLKGDVTVDIMTLLEDGLVVLGSLLNNRYNAPYKLKIQDWVSKLSATSEVIEKWLVVQNLWIYLEAVFVGRDIAKQLPQEAKRFGNIDRTWQSIMQKAHEMRNVVHCCSSDDSLLQLLQHLQEQLEICQKSLTGYLEKKRIVFPRFFFVSDPALLEILGQASDPRTIQSHLLSIFDNTKSVRFDGKISDKILALRSQEGEEVELSAPVYANGNVEIWLGELLKTTRSTVESLVEKAYVSISEAEFKLLEFQDSFPAQIGLLGLQMIWTFESEHALSQSRTNKNIMATTTGFFSSILSQLIQVTTKDLSHLERTKYETLITIHVHQKDIFDDLVKQNVRSADDFEWLKQTRFYMREENRLIVSITDVNFKYMNEYLGCTERLVITPLTDRCYITLAQALNISLGGAPAGPAGTGKTETTKDMGRCLGKYVVVFNCSDQMDFRGLGRIFKGLAQSGSWGCFDEFNRIELPVLSVAAQQISTVLTCKKERRPHFLFTDGDVLDMDPEFGIFLTMNPGYAGRQELPENLKINFRTVAMMIPDRAIIIRVKMASCGFQQNLVLSKKFFNLYKLCEEQLSKQVHYDFGLRNILSVLRTLGAVKRNSPEDGEMATVMKVLSDMNISKLVDDDEPLFISLVEDLFPGMVRQRESYGDVEEAIRIETEKSGLVHHAPWVLKMIQLYETQRVRHGIMILGPSGSGKTTCIRTLARALTRCGLQHKEVRMNPKAITASQMFGHLDVATNDWTDGIFSTLWRKTQKLKKGDHTWLVLDGPVDAIWIENLNSVLDDNKTLTLANGDRIPMSAACRIIFEVHNIDNASPATVSRNGMIFMSGSLINWRTMVKGHTEGEEFDVMMSTFGGIWSDAYTYVTQNLNPKMEILECMYVKQAIDVFQGLNSTLVQKSPKNLSRSITFALMWSLGALLESDDRKKLEQFLRNHENKLPLPPPEDSMFEYKVTEDGEWLHWKNMVVQAFSPPKNIATDYSNVLVPNVDNTRTEYLVDLVARHGKQVLLIGETGTAKTVMIQAYLNKYDKELHLYKKYNFSSTTTPQTLQREIEGHLEKRVGSSYGASAGRKMTLFLDDLNAPLTNQWGDQVTNEMTRQFIEAKGFYSLDHPGEFKSAVDVQVIAAMVHPGAGRNDIPQRLKRHFAIFNCPSPSDASVDRIFNSIACAHFTRERGFHEEVATKAQQLVQATRLVWQTTKQRLLSTPTKFHYVFNMRDLSRIWQGILNCTKEVIKEPQDLLSMWTHECQRVIADRFIGAADKLLFDEILRQTAGNIFGKEAASQMHNESCFVDFLYDVSESDEEAGNIYEAPRVYKAIASFELLHERLNLYMSQYNETVRGSRLDLVFFKEAMKNLARISRVIRTRGGHALLVGVEGSGRRSLTKLASFIAGYKTFQIALTRNYNQGNLVDDLKFLHKTAGLQGKGMTFIFSDNDIKDEYFLEYINALLSSGHISSLFPREEMDEILQELVPIMKKEDPRRPPSNENLQDFFASRVKANLHVILCFSPVGEKFRSRTLKFPGLLSGCTINWFDRWPTEALNAVSKHFLSDFVIDCGPQIKNQITQAMSDIHDGVASQCLEYFQKLRRHAHVTPKSFLSFVSTYKSLYESRHLQIDQLGKKMKSGVLKLVEASEAVNGLAEELLEKEKDLQLAKEKAEEVLEAVNLRSREAGKIKNDVLKVKEEAEKLVEEINLDKEEAERKLEQAEPMLLAAEEALKTIKPADIATVRKLGRPPHLVMRIMDCILLLFQRPLSATSFDYERQCVVPSWNEAIKITAQTNFLQSLMNFPKDTINDETVELLQPYLSIDDGEAEQASKSIKGLLLWSRAMAEFYAVNKDVLPLKNNLAVQEAHHLVASKKLEEAEKVLAEKQKDLESVQKEYADALKHNEALQRNADECRRKMMNARALIEGLAEEKTRWSQSGELYDEEIEKLAGDSVLAAGFLSYAGPFDRDFRSLMQSTMKEQLLARNIPFTSNMNVINMLSDNTMTSQWCLQGLPNDELSLQNGLIVVKSTRYPLLIDPQCQGKEWIKRANENLQVTNFDQKHFRNHLEDSLAFGRPLLIEDIGEELDPSISDIVERNFFKQGSVLKVKVSDKEVDVADGFALFLSTKFANPCYSPDVSAKVNIINFTVTREGLEDQLLGIVIMTERKELETERTRLMEGISENRKKLKSLEDNLLLRLASTKVSLVEDESLIHDLKVAKMTGKEVKEKLKTAADTEFRINSAREEFRPIAARGSVMYFLMVELNMVNHMYQTSLDQFLQLFKLAMQKAVKSPINFKRVQNIVDCLTTLTFRHTTRGLYENDKFLFSFLATLKIEKQKNVITDEEFNVLIKGGAALNMNSVTPKANKWLSDSIWLNLVELSKINPFSQILKQVAEHDKEWKNWFNSPMPEQIELPCQYSTKLSTFHKLMLIRSFCIDRTIPMARTYVKEVMGQQFVESPVLDMDALVNDSTERLPLLCLLSTGSDPTENVERLARTRGIKCSAISMGQGQEMHARRIMNEFTSEGGWLLLQNLHLALNYVDELLEHISDPARNVHPSFRLWITTEYHPKFSINLLQASVKYTFEPPQGVKAGLKRTYGMISKDLLEASHVSQWRSLIYATAFLHSVVQERKKFGPIGWSIPYEFNQADFTSSIQFIQNHLDELTSKKNISWSAIRYMIGEVHYGGRVTDDRDKRLLNTFAKIWFREGITDSSFQFANGYKIPACKSLEEYRSSLDELPSYDDPEVFGLNGNANIIYQTNSAKSLLDTMVNIQPKVSSGRGGESREAVTYRIADDMLAKLPQNFLIFKVEERLRAMGHLEPLNIFLAQELKRMMKVISTVSTTLKDLQMAIDGTIVMSDELRDVFHFIYDARTPSSWEKISWSSSSLGFWLTELINRFEQLELWLNQKRPTVFLLSAFFNPQGFLTATKQEITRSHKGWSLDDVIIDGEVTTMFKDDVFNPPAEGVYIHGLHLNGAGWDKKNSQLIEASLKVLFVPLPVVRIFATRSEKKMMNKKTTICSSYECPVYKRPVRTDLTYIFSLALKSAEPSDHWIRRGVALICDIK